MANPDTLILTDRNFAAEVLDSDVPVLVDFWAAWCGPCRALAPSIDRLATAFRGRAKVGKLDIDDNPQMARAFGIRSIPTLLLVRGGKVVDQVIGALPPAQLEALLERHLGAADRAAMEGRP